MAFYGEMSKHFSNNRKINGRPVEGGVGAGGRKGGGAGCSMGAQRKDQRDESVLLTVLNQYTRVFTPSGWMMQAKQTRAEVSEVKGGGGRL